MSTRSVKSAKSAAMASVVPPPEMVRLGSDVRDNLTTLKRRTGIANSNVLCRWALCRSLAESSAPTSPPAQDSSVEFAWKVFSGAGGDLFWWLLKMHCHQLGLALDEGTLHGQLRWHIARGASYLVGDKDMRDATSLANLVILADAQ